MAGQDWLRPEMPVEASGTAWAGTPSRQFELRPLSLGEILDRTFALYRSRFWLFAGISMLAAAVNAVGQAFSLAAAQKLFQQASTAPPPPGAAASIAAIAGFRAAAAANGSAYLVTVLFLLISAITQAATALAVTKVYMHRQASVKEALGKVLPRWYRWIGIAVWQGFSLAWIPMLAMIVGLIVFRMATLAGNPVLTVIGGVVLVLAILGGFPAGVMLYLRNALAVPAAVAEGLTIRPAMRRSKMLAAGTKGRIFMVLFIAVCLLEIVGILESPAGVLMVLSPNKAHYLARAIALVITFVGHTVVAPVALIGLTLVYFDQRVRKEALDLELLLEGARGPASLPIEPGVGTPVPPESYAP